MKQAYERVEQNGDEKEQEDVVTGTTAEDDHESNSAATTNSSSDDDFAASCPLEDPSPTQVDANLQISVPPNIKKAQRLIFVSHFVSQFSECAWQFAVVLFLAAVSDYQSILLVSS